jgi:hypothetical protein
MYNLSEYHVWRLSMVRLASSLFFLLCALVAVAAPGAAAQTADVPSGAECTVSPVQLLDMLAMLNEVEDVPALESISALDVEEGDAVSTADEAAIAAATRQLVACANAIDPFRMAALLSEDFQARLVMSVLDGNGIDALAEQLPVLATEANDNEGFLAIPITAAWYANNGQTEIAAILEPETSDSQARFLVTFVNVDGNWLFDNIQLIKE